MEFLLLAKVAMWFGIGEKVAVGVVSLFAASTGLKYVKDYRDSLEEEKIMKG